MGYPAPPQFMERLKASRGPRRPGEVFAMKLRGVGYLFGRVIRDDCAMAPGLDSPVHGPWRHVPGNYLVYIYKTVRRTAAPGGAEFVPELVHNRSGVGSHLAVQDVNKDGVLDILTSGTRGTFVFLGKPKAGAKTSASAAR